MILGECVWAVNLPSVLSSIFPLDLCSRIESLISRFWQWLWTPLWSLQSHFSPLFAIVYRCIDLFVLDLQRQLTASLKKKIDLFATEHLEYVLLLSYSNPESHSLKSHWLLWVSVDLIISSTIPRPVFAFSTLLCIATGLAQQATFSQAPFANWILARFGHCEAPMMWMEGKSQDNSPTLYSWFRLVPQQNYRLPGVITGE